jgi:hypothetical protein
LKITRRAALSGVAVALLIVGLIAFWLWQYTSPFPLSVPKDQTLIALFRSHRHVFQEIAELAVVDAPRHSDLESLTPERRSEYLRLLHQIPWRIKVGFTENRVTFSCARGGILLAIGPGWSKGIAYLPWGPAREGELVSSTDKDPGRDGIYLVPIEQKWYLLYQRFDYDD